MMFSGNDMVTCIAPSNIAVIKYWGKRDEALILPINDSISVTLDGMHAQTTVTAKPEFTDNELELNGKQEPFDTPRLNNVMRLFREVARKSGLYDACPERLDWKVHVSSKNNFPTAAGLASSAAGYSCLVFALAHLYGIANRVNLSELARLGSGSACRSVYGGFVQWCKGELADGSDSVAVQLATEKHWPELEILILVVSDNKKKTSSTSGMSRSVATSPFLKHRAAEIVPERIAAMKAAIKSRDFKAFGELTMKDSNQFHSVCLDTYPPCVYLNDISHAIIRAVHAYNEAWGDLKAAYTFDAGPNACIMMLRDNVAHFADYITRIFPKRDAKEFFRGSPTTTSALPASVAEQLDLEPVGEDLLQYVIHSKVGFGPQVIDDGGKGGQES